MTGRVTGPDGPPALADLQEWMSVVVRHPADAAAAFRSKAARRCFPNKAVLAGEVIRPNDRMTVADRLQVYNGAYLARLKEVLAGDFPAVQYAVGEHAFHHLVASYLERRPSRHPNLNQLGRAFPEFVARRRKLAHRAFAADLARLERMVSESFDAPEFEPLDTKELEALVPEQWAAAVLELNPSVRLAAFRHPVNDFYQRFKDEEQPPVPEPGASRVVTYRKGDRVWRMRLTKPMHAVLAAIGRGEALAQALGRAAGAGADVGRWFREWSGDGLFSGIRLAE